MTVTLFEGNETLEVVGESNYQDALWRIADATPPEEVRTETYAILVPEEDNQYDANAVSIWVAGLKVGYLSRDTAKQYRPGLKALMKERGNPIALSAVIVGGGTRQDGPGMLGIFLSHDPVDFGLPATERHEPSLRTGLSEAVATDEDDDSYDLAWLEALPSDAVKRIPRLRALLADELDPIDRHFMFAALEADLYYCRDTFPSALTDYDDTCERHHQEVVSTIRTALIDKFGAVPLIETYKQASIRHQKAYDWSAALMWAERGIEVYGSQAARPEVVDDLTRRTTRYRNKMGVS